MFTRLVVAGGILIAGVALTSACGKKAEEKAAEKMFERATGGQADVDIQSGKVRIRTKEGEAEFSGEGATWPEDLPREVPKLEEGRLIGVNRVSPGDSESWVLAFEDVEGEDYREFLGKVKGSGWEIAMTTSSDKVEIVQASRDGLALMMTYDSGDNGATIQVHRPSK